MRPTHRTYNHTADKTILVVSIVIALIAVLALAFDTSAFIPSVIANTDNDTDTSRDTLDIAEYTKWKYIVIHHTGTNSDSMTSMSNDLASRGEESIPQYHFVIGNGSETPKGGLEVSSRWYSQIPGSHLNDKVYDPISIGICIVGDYNQRDPDAKMLESLARVCATLVLRYRIDLNHLTTRYGMTKYIRSPGQRFNIIALRDRVADILASSKKMDLLKTLDGKTW